MSAQFEDYTLSPVEIDRISEKISEWLKQNNESLKNTIRMRLIMEEILLSLKNHFGEEQRCTLHIKKRLGVPSINIYCKGESFNPLNKEDEHDEYMEYFLKNLGISPIWSYRGGVNEISLRAVRPSHRFEFMILSSLVLALILGLLGPCFSESVSFIVKTVFSTISSVFMRLLNTFAGMMVFMCIVNGICGIGNINEFNKIGRKMIGRYIALSVLYTGLGLVFFTLVFNIHIGQPPKGENEVMKIFNMVFNILPDNPVKPFIDLNTLQIAVIGIFVGLLILSNGERLGNIKNAFQGGNILMSDAIYVICKLLPLYILSSLSLLFWQDGYALLLKLWKPILFTVIFDFILVLAVTAYGSIRLKISPALLVKKILPGSLIGLSTASSMAAFSTVFETCEKKLGIKTKLVKVGIPLGHITFVAPFSFIFTIPCLYMASNFGMEVDMIWLVVLGLLSVLISMSIPPVPGTFLACLTIVFSQLKIPVEGLSISATLGMLLDFVLTGARVYLNQIELLLQAKSYDMLDIDMLKRENV